VIDMFGLSLVVGLPFGAGSVWSDPERRRLGDRVADTVFLYR
jgi:hypothetical protein